MAGTSQHPSTMDAARRRSARSHRWRSYLPALPFIAVVACYELMPLLRLAADSFVGKESGALSLENYITVLTAPLYQRSIMNSVVIGLVSAAVGIVVAFLAARFCSEASPRVRRAFTMVLNMMSNFSGVPLAFAFMVLMGNAGVLTLVGRDLGIPFLADFDLYSGQGLMVLYIYFQIPLATLLLIPAFGGIKREWREAAMLLKATPLDYWFRIVIPNLMPSILGTFSVLFANALSAYATAYALLLNNYALLALQITSKFKGDVQIDAATGGALAVVLMLLMVACTLINNYFTRRTARGRELS
ncbi:ABC transporter permease subunit [Enorma burkinafasonensis]|uniref:ABC transporter permease n=1 Tax=Enorma burkinafasonensis TaxID=2590867 RepID=UPI0026ED6649|nr:ABC transporter permease subunit [Enorma burkinafasonensis]MCI7729818.1 ABC transporter permease subunit [Enorma burkinafasonensis]